MNDEPQTNLPEECLAWIRPGASDHLDRLHRVLREELLRIAEGKKVADNYGQEVAERLRIRSEEMRMEALAEWWHTAKVADDHLDTLETHLVKAFSSSTDEIPYVTIFLDAESQRNWDKKREAAMASGNWPPENYSPPTYVAAWMNLKRTDALPPKSFLDASEHLAKDTRHLAALDGLREMLECHLWPPLGRTLENPEWLLLLARLWITEKAEEEKKRLDQESGSMLLSQVRRTTVGESEIGRVAKPLAGLSWAFGGQGETETVRIGEAFDIDVILPRSAGLLREREPYQSLLPLSDGTPENQSEPDHLFALLASQNREMLPIVTGKLALLIMDACRRNTRGNGTIETTLREITSFINPKPPGPDGKKHRLKLSHYQTTLRALQSMNGIRVVIPGEYVTYSVFDCALPFREARPEEYDSQIFLGLARSFQSAIDRRKGGIFRGEFIFDMTKMMALKKASQFRAGIAAYAEWNKLRPNAGSEPPVIKTTVENWGLRINAFSAGALRAMAGDSSARRKKSEDLKEIKSDLEKLHEDNVLRILEMNSKKGLWIGSPMYLEEAYREARGRKTRAGERVSAVGK